MKPDTARAAAVLALIAACVYLLRGMLPAVAWSVLLAVATWPLHERIAAALGFPRHASAALLTAATVLALLLPLAWLAWRGLLEAPVLLRVWAASNEAGLPAPRWLASLPWLGDWAVRQWNEWLAQPGALSALAHGMAGNLHGVQTGRRLLAEAGHGAMSVFFCVLVLFFLYRDGDALAAQVEAVVERQFGRDGVKTLRLAVRAVRGTVNGLVLVGLGVAVVMSVAYAAAGVPHPAVWGLATGLLGMVPFGAALALAGVVLYLVAMGAGTAAVALGAFGVVLIFVVDHFVRPLFIAGSSRLPLVLALLGIVGGLETFGVLGIFIGPALLAVVAAMWRQRAATAAAEREHLPRRDEA